MQLKKPALSASSPAVFPARKWGMWLLGILIATLVIFNSPGLFDQAGMRAALLGSGAAALATALGTLPVLLSHNFTQRTFDGFMGFGAGIMLGATAFSLVMPAIESARELASYPIAGTAIVGAGMAIGALLLLALDKYLKSRIAPLADSVDSPRVIKTSVWLFVLAIAAHNIPEGLAIGIAYAGVDIDKAHSLATGISIQDLPEGLVIAIALRTAGYPRMKATAIGAASGLVEPLAAFLGVHIIGMAYFLLPWGLAIAAGAMLFVIVNEVIPQCHRNANGLLSSCLLVAGFVLMLILDAS